MIKRRDRRIYLNIVMSWSISFIGTPEKVAEAVTEYVEKLSGQSGIEYADALPNIVGLVKQNFGNKDQLIKLNASGHGTANSVEQINRQATINLEVFYSKLV